MTKDIGRLLLVALVILSLGGNVTLGGLWSQSQSRLFRAEQHHAEYLTQTAEQAKATERFTDELRRNVQAREREAEKQSARARAAESRLNRANQRLSAALAEVSRLEEEGLQDALREAFGGNIACYLDEQASEVACTFGDLEARVALETWERLQFELEAGPERIEQAMANTKKALLHLNSQALRELGEKAVVQRKRADDAEAKLTLEQKMRDDAEAEAKIYRIATLAGVPVSFLVGSVLGGFVGNALPRR